MSICLSKIDASCVVSLFLWQYQINVCLCAWLLWLRWIRRPFVLSPWCVNKRAVHAVSFFLKSGAITRPARWRRRRDRSSYKELLEILHLRTFALFFSWRFVRLCFHWSMPSVVFVLPLSWLTIAFPLISHKHSLVWSVFVIFIDPIIFLPEEWLSVIWFQSILTRDAFSVQHWWFRKAE